MGRLKTGCGTACFVLLLGLSLHAQSKLPDGKGKELVQRECAKCHGLEGVVSARMTKERWGNVVDDMVSRGATGTDQEIDQIIDYLAANFGKQPARTNTAASPKINVNKASATELATALGVSDTDASAIVRYREKNGGIKDVDDLKKVPGLDAKIIDEKRDRLEF
jgi:competence protein ComEA